ncbi:steroid receptor RNA activator 1-like isoform X2 [Haliotis asinina]|uniref:steroid receptor RNA activator 1-like isoform X2 n=1 Tax=Haliotis asinina TaxID=109174 RepID=UPI0035321275
MAAPRPGNTDRGWNDPPLFNYGSAAQSQASPRRTALNKRVAYPMATPPSAGDGTTSILNPAEGPPKLGNIQLLPPAVNTCTPTPLPVVVPTLIPTPEPGSQLSPGLISHPGVARPVAENRETLDDVIARLKMEDEAELLTYIQEALKTVRDKCSGQLKGRAAEDVMRRIALLQEMWQGGQVSPPVKVRLGQLAEALKENNLDLANSIHLSLMVDYTNEVNQWMVGIKRLIQELYSLQAQNTAAEQPCSSPSDDPQGQGQTSETLTSTETQPVVGDS